MQATQEGRQRKLLPHLLFIYYKKHTLYLIFYFSLKTENQKEK